MSWQKKSIVMLVLMVAVVIAAEDSIADSNSMEEEMEVDLEELELSEEDDANEHLGEPILSSAVTAVEENEKTSFLSLFGLVVLLPVMAMFVPPLRRRRREKKQKRLEYISQEY